MKRIKLASYEDILEDICAGNPVAFSRLYDFFYPPLLQYVISKVSILSAAEDILHDLFLRLWLNRAKIHEIESIPAYLYSSCRYLTIAYIQKSSVWNSSNDFSELELYYHETPAEERMHYRYLLDMVHKEIENLPDKCKEIFKLSRDQHMSNKQIAEYLGISESTVQNQIHKALKRIKLVAKDIFPFIALLYRI